MKRLLGFFGALFFSGLAVAGYHAWLPEVEKRLARGSVQFDRDSIDFGETVAGIALTSSVIATNLGEAPISLGAFEAEGPFRPRQRRVEIAGGQAVILQFEFSSDRAGRYEQELVAETDQGRRVVLALRGEAIAPPELELQPSALDFGPVLIGSERTTPLKILNRGKGTLEISRLRGAGNFSFSENSLEIAPEGEAVVFVTFVAKRAGLSGAQLQLSTNVPGRDVVGFPGRGFGVKEIAEPVVKIQPSTLTFGRVVPGQSVKRWIAIKNLSDAPLAITSVLVDGPFRISTRSRSIAAQSFVRLPITFTPRTPGAAVEGSVSFFTNDPSAGQIAIAVRAEVSEQSVAIVSAVEAEATESPETPRSRARVLVESFAEALFGKSTGGGGAGADVDPGDASAPPETPGGSSAATAFQALEVDEGSQVVVASYGEPISSPNLERAFYDAENGQVTLQGLQLPTINAALGEHFSFSKMDVIASVDEVGEVTATVPVQIIDGYGNPTFVDVRFTTETASSTFEGREFAIAGTPMAQDGSMTLVAIERVPGGALRGQPLQLMMHIKVE